MKICIEPEFSRVFQRPVHIYQSSSKWFLLIDNPMFLTQGFDLWCHLVVVMAWHCGKQVVFDLKVEVSGDPVVEGRLLHVAGGLELHAQPALVLLMVYVHGQVVHLSHPHKPMAFQKPDKNEESQRA